MSHYYATLTHSASERNSDEVAIKKAPNKKKNCIGSRDWMENYCGDDGLIHGCTEPTAHPALLFKKFGQCWKQCSYGGSKWCLTGFWKWGFWINFNYCKPKIDKTKEQLGKLCYGNGNTFCRTLCYKKSWGKNE